MRCCSKERNLTHNQNLQIPPKDNTLTLESLYALRRKLAETTKLHAALLAEKTRNAAQIAKLRSLLQPAMAPKREPCSSTSPAKSHDQNGTNGDTPFAFLTHSSAAQSLGVQPLPQTSTSSVPPESRTPLTTHTTFTTSQLPYLSQLLASLKPHLATTALPSRSEGEKEELARERRIYVESQSKRILERRGVDTTGGVEGAVEGSRVRAEEVRGLESIVAGMQRGRGEEEGDAMDTS